MFSLNIDSNEEDSILFLKFHFYFISFFFLVSENFLQTIGKLIKLA